LGRRRQAFVGPREDDPRVVRSRAAVVDAARTLFLREGFSGATIEDIAALAGVTKRTVYNNYADKEALFVQIVEDIIGYAGAFAREFDEALGAPITAANLRTNLDEIGRRLAFAILQPSVIAVRRLLIAEARNLPVLAKDYYDRVPAQVLNVLASGFERLSKTGLLRVTDSRCAAAQFAYLIVGEPLDRAVLAGRIPPRNYVVTSAREGVETFLARYRAP
jgi:TetR/AcrR family transcriptional repressor of mexJK operon